MAHFDLVIDTYKITPRAAIPMVIEANKAVMSSICEPGECTSSIAVDDILLETTHKVIEGQ
jgi:putative heme iron utilization protein